MRILIIICLLPLICKSQATDPSEMLDRVADQLLATAEEDIGYEELYETLTHLLANPVDLNAVNREQLRTCMLLSEREIAELLAYRDLEGPFIHTLELQAVPGWSLETIRKVMPFVTVTDPNAGIGRKLFHRIVGENNQYLVARYERVIEDRPAYHPSSDSSQRYAGSPDRYYIRYRNARRNDFSIGFTAEKDPGEALDWSPGTSNYGFDFYSGHIQLMNKGVVDNIVVGDFQAQFGQGLQLGSAFGLGKTAQTITGIRRSNLGFMPYVSAGEITFLRGVATTFRISNPLRLHLFGSLKHVDGSIQPGEKVISSLQSSGLHRTPREIDAKGKIGDRDLGLAFEIRLPRLDMGFLVHQKERTHSIIPDTTPYNQFQFRGSGYMNAGVYINYALGGVCLFSEYAHTWGHGSAMTAGLMGNITSKLEMAWLYRNFDKDYFSSFANPVSETSVPQNEQGFYWGTRYSFNRRLTFHGYLDYFQFPWLRYRVYQPSDGVEGLLRIDYSPRRGMTFFIQAREEMKARNQAPDQYLYRATSATRSSLWISAEFAMTPSLTIKSRIQGSQYDAGQTITRGLAAIQEVTWKWNRWSVTARYALFDTDDYDNRQYVYEKDVWLATSLPAYEGTGIRNYVLVHFEATRHLDFWVRWARTTYHDRDVIGSGLEQIAGNERNDVKFQVRIRP